MRDVLHYTLFEVADSPITVATLIAVLAVMGVTVLLSRLVRTGAERAIHRRGGRGADIATFAALLHYLILIGGFAIALDTVGIDLTALFAAGALFAVALGFAMQSIVQNFVAGVILLTERSIKPGDVLQVEGKTVKVFQMGIRSSIARTRDGEDLVIPNSVLIQTTVTNYTLRDQAFRIRAQVGVTYRSDMRQVRATLEGVAELVNRKWAVPDSKPQVIMTGFGNSSVDWEVAIWMNNPWELRPALSDLHEEIWRALQERGIVIAFPQVDVHFDPAVTKGIGQLSGAAA
jgi:small-conductance mechanosensitive channel